ncbi:unnamed protein product [Ectocarpus sp. CCAP 1310/34]|nr:unnamed protein product [Ectocarpus sp. CCAP 1310/34]
MLTDADQAMAAALREWKTTVHLWCLSHLNKNVVKHCSSSFSDMKTREKMLRLFRNAAYAATPETFAAYRADLERTVNGKKCDQYIRDLLEEKTKWAFSCRLTALTLGMFATQRTEGMFGVAKKSGIHKNLSLCALWDRLQHVYQTVDIEHGREKTKWAFSCRLTALTLGMFATQRTEGMFGVAKKSGIHKKLSLCALWDRLQHVYQTVDIEHGSRYIYPFPFLVLTVLFSRGSNPTTSQCAPVHCTLQEAKDELGASQSYDVEVICVGAADAEGRPVPLEGGVLRQQLEAAHFDFNLCEEAPPDTDLEIDCKLGPRLNRPRTTPFWARTSLEALLDLVSRVPVHLAAAVRYKLTPSRPGHIVVFGPGGFYLCSWLKILRHGLPCRHYFAVLVRFIGGKYGGVLLNHEFDGNSVHTRCRQSPDGSDAPWTVSRVLEGAGHGDGWDGCDHG